MKIIFFGASRFVLPVIEMLHTNFELALVVTTERDPLDAVPTYCQKNNIPYISIKTASEALPRIQETNAELGVLAYFGVLLPKEMLGAFPKGILNIHPSRLPKYRGATPVQSALLKNENETGVTIITLDEQMDHGPMLVQETEMILPADTTETLHERLFTKGTKMLQEIIPDYLAGKLPLQPQNDTEATYTKRSFTKQDGLIDSTNPPSSEQLDRMIRAYYPWPTVWTRLPINGTEKIVKLLPEGKLQVEGKNPMSIKDFMNGYPTLQKVIKDIFHE